MNTPEQSCASMYLKLRMGCDIFGSALDNSCSPLHSGFSFSPHIDAETLRLVLFPNEKGTRETRSTSDISNLNVDFLPFGQCVVLAPSERRSMVASLS